MEKEINVQNQDVFDVNDDFLNDALEDSNIIVEIPTGESL